ncbi:MAG: cohesin domain-containing protein [bacterium]
MKPETYHKKLKFLFALFVVVFLFFPFLPARAEGGSLYFSPSAGTFFVDNTFDVSIFMNSGKKDVNAVKVDLRFDPKKLQIASPTAGKSFISVWISQPAYSNQDGTASFQGGIPSPGINTSSGLVSTITFRAIAPGKTSIYIENSSQVLLNDGAGTDILSSTGKATYELTIPPPEGPKVFSSTHPDKNKWYRNNNPSIEWEKEEGVNAFSYEIDNSSYTVPDNNPEGEAISKSYSELEDGIWYFHIKARKGETWGGTSHYPLQIDTTGPAAFIPQIDPKPRATGTAVKNSIITFFTTDNLSGMDHFEIKTIKLEPGEEAETGFFIEAASPYRLPVSETGERQIVVRAYDQAGNWRDASLKIEIIDSQEPFFLTKYGIGFFQFFFLWWQIAAGFAILIAAIIIFIILLKRIRRRDAKNNFIKIENQQTPQDYTSPDGRLNMPSELPSPRSRKIF